MTSRPVNFFQPEQVPTYGASARQVGGDHYRKLGIQPWEAMEAWYSTEEFLAYLKLTAVAYQARAGHKGPEHEDIEKAHHVLEKWLEVYHKVKT